MLGESGDRRVQPTLHRAQGDVELLCDLGITEPLEIGEKENFLERLRHSINSLLNKLITFLTLHRLIREGHRNLHQVDEGLPAFGVPTQRRRKVYFLTTYPLTKHVPGFVRRDREKPRFELTGCIEGVGGYVDLEERFLEDILRGLTIARKPSQEPQEVFLVAFNQGSERRGIPVLVVLKELFVGSGGQGWS